MKLPPSTSETAGTYDDRVTSMINGLKAARFRSGQLTPKTARDLLVRAECIAACLQAYLLARRRDGHEVSEREKFKI